MLFKSKYGYSVWRGPKLRAFKFLWQRLTRGWDETEVWNLDVSIAKFVLPRLRLLRDIKHGYPFGLTEEQWEETMDKMILTFSSIVNNQIDEQHVEEGLDLFRKYYFNLWD